MDPMAAIVLGAPAAVGAGLAVLRLSTGRTVLRGLLLVLGVALAATLAWDLSTTRSGSGVFSGVVFVAMGLPVALTILGAYAVTTLAGRFALKLFGGRKA